MASSHRIHTSKKQAASHEKVYGAKTSRMDLLARPSTRRMQNLLKERGHIMSATLGNNIKSALEAETFDNPQKTESYFRQRMLASKDDSKKKQPDSRRERWLASFSAQVARRLCEWVAEKKDSHYERTSVNGSSLADIADVVLTRVANILGESKPQRTDPTRLARFMVAVSDRIAVWIDEVIGASRDSQYKKNHETLVRDL